MKLGTTVSACQCVLKGCAAVSCAELSHGGHSVVQAEVKGSDCETLLLCHNDVGADVFLPIVRWPLVTLSGER